jgi:hypothetical protein
LKGVFIFALEMMFDFLESLIPSLGYGYFLEIGICIAGVLGNGI